ncbi:MAG TPA: XRE family transcriptional regulator [Syntrophomonas sp.]|nr:XRE family transcriptional regulator [Syntrophomonas sp.]
MLGERLRKAREEKGLTQAFVAKALNISASAVGMYEQGRRDPDTEALKQFAQLYEVSTDYLLDLDPSPKDDVRQHVNDDEALEYLDELHKRPEMKILFQVGRKATKEDIETAITIIEALKKKGGKEDE